MLEWFIEYVTGCGPQTQISRLLSKRRQVLGRGGEADARLGNFQVQQRVTLQDDRSYRGILMERCVDLSIKNDIVDSRVTELRKRILL
jgi:hypothetical protein